VLQISWSGLQRYSECKQKHKLIISGKSLPTKDVRIFLQGTVLDRAMRGWLEDEAGGDTLKKRVETLFEHYADENPEGVIRWRGRQDRPLLLNKLRRAANELEPLLHELILPYDYEPELRFRTYINIPYIDGTMSAVLLVGGVDVMVRKSQDPLHLAFWDLKCTENENYWRKTLGQLLFYETALCANFGCSTEAFDQIGLIQPLCKEKTVPVAFDEADRSTMMAKIIDMAHSMWRGEFEPKESDTGCSYCEVRHACDKFQLTLLPHTAGQKRTTFTRGTAQ
jgi:CRISPR/Cas system-associated exonuclease Cas4 (RecB family)